MAATEKKPTRAEKMYGRSPRIRAAEDAGPEKKPETKAKEDAEPAADQTAQEEAAEGDGGGGIPLTHVHSRELKAAHTRMEKERRDMHARHEQELSSMARRHDKERAAEDQAGGDGEAAAEVMDKAA